MAISDPAYAANEQSTQGSNIFASALRRWWLLAITGVLGAIVGFFGYSTQTPVFQVSAQVQVLKRDLLRQGIGQGGMYSVFDDYLSGQIELIKSDTVLLPASKSPSMKSCSAEFQARIRLNEEGPARDQAVIPVLRNMFGVTRSREALSGAVNNSTLNLTFNCTSIEDAKHALDAIIEAYKKELETRSKSTITERVETHKKQQELIETSIREEEEKKASKNRERQVLSPEPFEVINARWTKNRTELFTLKQNLIEIESSLKTIEGAGKNRNDRRKLFIVLNGTRGTNFDNTIERELAILELKRASLLDGTTGRQHPSAKELDTQINFLKGEMTRNDLGGKEGEFDELALQEAFLRQRKDSAVRQIKNLDDIVEVDFGILNLLSPVVDSIQRHEQQIVRLNNSLSETKRELEMAQIVERVTNDTGGFDARVQNKPGNGTKVAPTLLTWVFPGLVLGILLGFGAAMLLELQDKSYRSPAEIRERLKAPILGHLPPIRTEMAREADVPANWEPTLVSAIRPKSSEAEAYRGIRTQIIQATEDKGHQLIQVTSPSPGDGKSTLAANLAISLAQSGKKTVLIDCDFRKPRVHKLFGIDKPSVGLATAIAGLNDLDSAIIPSSVDRLDILPCGPRPNNPAELLTSLRFQEALNELKTKYDYVIIDTPPLLAVSDPRVVAQRADGVILTFRVMKKIKPLAERAKEYLDDIGATVFGIAINSTDASVANYGYGYGYGYGYSYKYAYEYEYEYAEQYGDDQSKF